ncbi:MAG: alpha/beta hydrolase-fold protein [Ferruginibacter sp.]
MKNISIIFLLLFSLPAISQLPKVSSGTLRRFENFPSQYVQARNVDVWLPANYDSSKKYATLYMNDGQALFDSSIMWNKQEWQVDETISKLLREGKIRDCIVIAIWNNSAQRWSEYFPEKVLINIPTIQRENLLREEMTRRARGDDYLRFIVNELKPFIDNHFAVYSDQSNTFIAGSSMGGLISLYAVCEYPKIFGGAACISTHWPGSLKVFDNTIPYAINRYLQQSLPGPKTHTFYFDYGSETLDSYYKPLQLRIDSTMTNAGYDSSNWKTNEFPGAEHSENSWSKRLDVPVLFLLGKRMGE